MTIGILDLSVVTDLLRNHLKSCSESFQPWLDDDTTKFNIDFTGLAPDAARSSGNGCHVSVYLFHTVADRFYRNTHPAGGSAQRIPHQPFALKLYYLVTAYSASSYIQEQQAMSIVLKCFHEWPLVALPTHEVTLSIEPQTLDEMGRLWQAIANPMRLSAVYCVSVVFLQPPLVTETVRPVLHAPTFDPPFDIRPFVPPPDPGLAFSANAGGRATITLPTAVLATSITEVDLRALPLAETTVQPPAPGRFRIIDTRRLDLQVPPTTPAGRYRIEVRVKDRARFEVWLDVPRPLVATASAGVATIELSGGGFGAGTGVAFAATALSATTTHPPAAGQFHVVDADNIEIGVPAATAAGRYLVHLRPAATPAFEAWVDVP